MAIADDFQVYANGAIRHVSGSTNYTVIQLHRWLGDLMDDAQASGNDLVDITDATASERATDNLITLKAPYNIDDDAAQYLYDGSIVQDNGDTIWDGLVIIAAAGMYLQIIQNGALLAPNFWTTSYNADALNGISHRFMVKVRSGGSDIDGRRLLGTTREWGYTYSSFKINGTSRGNNVMALNYATDLNNDTAEGTVATWTDITNTTEGYNTMDVDQDTTDEAYYSEWDAKTGHTSINDLYERMKWLTRRGSSSTLYGLDGDLFRGITHDVAVTTPRTGTFPAFGAVTWTGGSGQMLAIDSVGTATRMWIQLMTGVAPTNGQTITGPVGSGSPTVTVSGTPTERALSEPFCGASTGSAIIGAYGFGIESGDLTNADLVFDMLTGDPITPPNQVQFTVGGLNYETSPYDRVLVGPQGYYLQYYGEQTGPFQRGEYITCTTPTANLYLSDLLDLGTTGFMKVRLISGSAPVGNTVLSGDTSGATANAFAAAVVSEDPRQLKLLTTLSGATETQVVCTSAIPTDTPKPSGTIRIQRDTGIFARVPYTSYTGSTFTINSSNWTGANTATGGAAEAGASIFISYIDDNASAASESFTSVYSANRSLFVRVRFGDAAAPIKTFESGATLTGAGGSVSAIRTSDA